MSAAMPARRWANGVLGGLGDLLGLLVPVDCAGCGTPGASVCQRCRQVLFVPPRRLAVAAGADGVPIWSGPVYEDALARIVVAWKERGRHDAVPVLGAALAAGPLSAVLAGLDGPAAARGGSPPGGEPVLVVPVPSSRAAVQARGEHHIRRLALHAAGQLRRTGSGLPAVRVADVLRVRPGVADQAGLGAAERQQNLREALVRRRGTEVAGRRCVVVDDVHTTGATLAAAVVALLRQDADVIGACALAATPSRRRLSAGRRED